ncbi:hypothetical protein BUALT_Bualt04G0054300 [Buddleja alternifolia]|uniref:DNA repair metallo-beta-lactamase domain-containing protein n=1 Tax=Buddleja alternifolia TaxID=168488 RepID=A0AAV6XUM8_9LAMI|nr:hypothetical protein BUALT_Bualt04G0054300 [Buddleja alternifolia]
MPIEMPKGVPFSVDTWTACSKRKRHHFITHAHKDHAQGILAHASYPIYSTLFTKTLLLKYYPQLDESMFVGIEIGQSLIVEDPDGDFTVSAFDANHCPGAVMFLFEGNFGNILHTGDCRLTPECLQCLPEKYIGKKEKEPSCPFDYVFLDCTFGQFPLKMPSRQTAVQQLSHFWLRIRLSVKQVINCIWKHPNACTVYLTCDLLGQEEILVEVSQTFGEKIYVDKAKNSECLKSLELTVPEIISQDPSCRFQLFDGFPKLYERAEAKIAEARVNFQHEPLIIRPSAQWYACDEGFSDRERDRKERFGRAVKDIFGVWHVCYSIHSSRDELEWALQLLAPKWVVSTTPNCRAMELDYVRNHCFSNQRAFDESLQKLLDISAVASLDPDVSVKSLSCSHVVESISTSFRVAQSEPVVISAPQRKRLSLSPPSKRPMVTLFGRARHGLRDSALQHEQKKEIVHTTCDYTGSASTRMEDESSQKEDVVEVKYEELLGTKTMDDITETKSTYRDIKTEKHKLDDIAPISFNINTGKHKLDDNTPISLDIDTGKHKLYDIAPISLSKSYNENLRRFYRSKNVPVPQPLPSLAELMDAKNSGRKKM